MLKYELQFFGGRGSGGGKSGGVAKKQLSKKMQEFADSLKNMSTSQLSMVMFNEHGLYSKKEQKMAEEEWQSRTKPTTTTWDKATTDWFHAQMLAARAGGASVDTMIGIEANLRDQANRRMRSRKKG